MRKSTCLIIVFVTAMSCAAPAQDPVYLADANLTAAVEETLGIGDPNTTDMLELIHFDASERGIVDLTVLEYATNMWNLNLHGNQVSDISSLTDLTGLMKPNLRQNLIGDISALSGLTNLTELWLSENQISDVSVVEGLTNLAILDLAYNQLDQRYFIFIGFGSCSAA